MILWQVWTTYHCNYLPGHLEIAMVIGMRWRPVSNVTRSPFSISGSGLDCFKFLFLFSSFYTTTKMCHSYYIMCCSLSWLSVCRLNGFPGLVKMCLNRIFPISSLSFFFLQCFAIFTLNYASVSFDFSSSKLLWNPIIF
jgi:hypothetical protein